jgi:hypothetical protein
MTSLAAWDIRSRERQFPMCEMVLSTLSCFPEVSRRSVSQPETLPNGPSPDRVERLRVDAELERAVARVCCMRAMTQCAGLVRRITSPRDPFPRLGASAIQDAVQLCFQVLRRNRSAFRR